MKKLLAPMTLAILTTACATAGYPMQQMSPMYPGRPMYGPPPRRPSRQVISCPCFRSAGGTT